MNTYIYCALLSLLFLTVTVHYVKKRKLEFQYCVFWIIISLTLIILSINKNILETISRKIGIYYSPALLFVTGIVFSFLLIFHLTIVISDLKKRVVKLTQELAILKNNMEDKNA
ncbi:DUF2304 domain-containing protein [Clostridium sp. YIM B02515]|uniref:DUF2304 domain-containing protein n=1 Tax=Clostridium rhizosphaerae TaxID=2803861 RepID=A0ABS1T9W0_9CLOT|nr:DUF2304 domain-containing protein [Clostridium rhizosphaerae]MBL4935542.1 DUF2304 domain-containing protein [Clostridium rhizosphaerae]